MRAISFLLFSLFCIELHLYAFTLSDVEYNTHNSYIGIVVEKIVPNTDDSFVVTLYNSNSNDPYDGVTYQTSYNFCWYLSYKGKRVSDYFYSNIKCKKYDVKMVYIYPNEVPNGHERYISVQFGREQNINQIDRRDDGTYYN